MDDGGRGRCPAVFAPVIPAFSAECAEINIVMCNKEIALTIFNYALIKFLLAINIDSIVLAVSLCSRDTRLCFWHLSPT